jgi:hypothetical protein
MHVEEMLLLVVALQVVAIELDELIGNIESLLVQHIREQQRLNRLLPEQMKRPTWQEFTCRIGPDHFHCMFRMTEEMFDKLVALVCSAIGQEQFKPEAYLMQREWGGKNLPVAGEIKQVSDIDLDAARRVLSGSDSFVWGEVYSPLQHLLSRVLRLDRSNFPVPFGIMDSRI